MRTATAVAGVTAAVAVWFVGVYGDNIAIGIRYKKEDPVAECSHAYEEFKTDFVRAEWHWFPPEYRCIFRNDDGTTRSLPAK